MKIRRIGNYLNINEQGYLVNRSNIQNNQSHWLLTIEAVKDIYLKTWADNIHSIYVRGSIAKGIALDNVSDIDSFAVLKADHTILNSLKIIMNVLFYLIMCLIFFIKAQLIYLRWKFLAIKEY